MAGLGGSQTLTRKVVRYGWMPLVALAGTTALESGERQSLAQAVDGIQKSFHISDFEVSLLPFAMALIGVVGSFPIGVLTDRVRRTVLLGVAMLVWTACMGLNGLAGSYLVLFAFRLGVGAVEANGPAAVSLLSDYYPAKDRAKNMGLYQSGALVGALIGLVGGGVAVQLAGWRAAFWMWIPIGLVVAFVVFRQPEPQRGDQDANFEADLALAAAPAGELVQVSRILPEPLRIGTLDYRTCSQRDAARELLHIRSMWFGVLSLTISNLLLNGLQFWGVPYFKRVHHLDAAAAGGVTGLLGLGAVFGILGGGFLADRLLRRGVLCARVYVVAFGSIAATMVLLPAFASTSLLVTAPLLFLGGALLTLPVAPAEALVSDVVVAQLRGRAATIRGVVRSLANGGAVIIGGVSTLLISSQGLSRADGLRYALVAITPLYAIGGVIMLLAARSYPTDLAFVVAEAQRLKADDSD
jgi:MFS family permease